MEADISRLFLKDRSCTRLHIMACRSMVSAIRTAISLKVL